METMFFRPKSLNEAISLMNQPEGAVIVNGGSDIVLAIAAKKISPAAIVYVEGIEGMNTITDDGEYVRIGGSVTYRQMQRSPICQETIGLMEAIRYLGSPPVRSVATPAGNIATAAPSADCATMMLALGTEVLLVSADGERVVPHKEIYTGTYKTAIRKNEIIRELRFPSLKKGMGTGYCRLARRKAQDIAKVLVGALVQLDKEGRCINATVSLGALNATAVLAPSTAELILGMNKSEAVQTAENNFPSEAGLRESYFKHYKELTTGNAVARSLAMAYDEAMRRL